MVRVDSYGFHHDFYGRSHRLAKLVDTGNAGCDAGPVDGGRPHFPLRFNVTRCMVERNNRVVSALYRSISKVGSTYMPRHACIVEILASCCF